MYANHYKEVIMNDFLKIMIILLIQIESLWAQTLTLYSSRSEHLIQPILDEYQKEKGIKVQLFTSKAASLIEKISKEKEHSTADILMTVDAGNLWYAEQQGIFSPVQSEILAKNIPSHLKSVHNKWFGFSVRARTIVYNTKKSI